MLFYDLTKTHYKRFLNKILEKPNGCWEWQAKTDKFGYGYFTMNRKTLLAHRVSYITFNGKIPEGLQVMHKCDNPACVNPDHLTLGKPEDNVHDMMEKGRANKCNGDGHWNSKMSIDMVKAMRDLYFVDGFKCVDISLIFNINFKTVWGALNNFTWKHIDYPEYIKRYGPARVT